MPVVKLNARNTTMSHAVGGLRTDYRDELLPGFFLRVMPQGTRTIGIVYTTREGRLRRHRLGPVGPLGLAESARTGEETPWRCRHDVAQRELLGRAIPPPTRAYTFRSWITSGLPSIFTVRANGLSMGASRKRTARVSAPM
jgi:hypothetical protein